MTGWHVYIGARAGEGVPLIIEVAKPEQSQRGVFFGAVPCGSCCNRTLSLVNKGRAAAHVSFGPSAELLQQLGIEVIPAEGVLLKARQTADLTLLYRWVGVLVFQIRLSARMAGLKIMQANLTELRSTVLCMRCVILTSCKSLVACDASPC
jgi:hypothetical protein